MPSDVLVFLIVVVVLALGIGVATRRARRGRTELPPRPERKELPEAEEEAEEAAEEEEEPEAGAEAEAEAEAEEDAEKKQKKKALRIGLEKTRSGFIAKLTSLFGGRKQIDVDTMDRLEEVLLTADIGVKTSRRIFESLKQDLSKDQLADVDAIWAHIRKLSTEILEVGAAPVDLDRHRPFVILVIGVNGVGKTTTIGKLASKYQKLGKKVLLAAGDTFRAAATEQLEVWAGRVGCPIVKGKEGGDPSSVIFDAVKRAQAEGFDVVLADTAGRLHTKTNLMEELQKVRRVTGKAQEGAPHETFLVLDATTGQNAIAQAQMFQSAVQASGIILTKLDGTAKGGVILGIGDELKVPVRYIGIGEKVEDLREFDARDFVDALYDVGGDGKSAYGAASAAGAPAEVD
jgi:fused signal recognition particle receptor